MESAAWTGPPSRIGVISDTHVAAPHVDVPRIERLVARMVAERPDVVMLLGDYTGGSAPAAARPEAQRAEILAGVEAFRGLRSPLGTYGVLGNHDLWFDDAAIAAAMARGSVRVLENRTERVARPGGAFWVAGLADMHFAARGTPRGPYGGPGDGRRAGRRPDPLARPSSRSRTASP